MANTPEDKEQTSSWRRSLVMFGQGAYNGLTELAALPGYLVDAANNLPRVVGLGKASENPVGGSDWIRNKLNGAKSAYDGAINFTPPKPASTADEIAYGAGDLTATSLMAGPLAKAAAPFVQNAEIAKNIGTGVAGYGSSAVAAAQSSKFSFRSAWTGVKRFLGFETPYIVSTDSGKAIAKATAGNIASSKPALEAGKAVIAGTSTPKKGLLRMSLGALGLAGGDQLLTGGKVTEVVVDGAGAVLNGVGTVAAAGAENLDDKVTGGKVKGALEGAKDMVTGDSKAGEDEDGVDWGAIADGAAGKGSQFFKDNWLGLALGGLMGMNANGGIAKKLFVGALWTAFLLPVIKWLKPVIMPFLQPVIDGFTDFYKPDGKGKSAPGAGAAKFTPKTETPAPAAAAAAPAGTQPTAATADGMAQPALYAVADPVGAKPDTIEAKVERRIEQMRATSPDAVQLASKKNEEQFRRLLTEQYTDEQRANSAPATSGPAQDRKLAATGPVELSLA
jgi:hypothetical protein